MAGRQTQMRIAVLEGGLSAEREVSLKSGKAVADALRSRGFDVIQIDVTRDLARQLTEAGVQVAVNMLHGTYGEDGCVQGLLEIMGIPYTGSGVEASALAMDKVRTKRLLAAAGMPVARDVVLAPGDIDGFESPFGYPVVVKPVAEGSSVGTAVVQAPEEFATALEQAAEFGSLMVEQYVGGPEITVSMLDGQALPPVEIRPHDGFYDFSNMYTSGCTSYICPAEIPQSSIEYVQSLARQACDALGVLGVARVDFMMGGGPVVLEVNTIPGMTELSLVPMAAREAGLDFGDLAVRILQGAAVQQKVGNLEGRG